MLYTRTSPHPALIDYVREYMFFSIDDADHLAGYVKALPPVNECGIEFLPAGVATVIHKENDVQQRESRVVIFGYPTFRKDFIMPQGRYLVARVIFHPGAFNVFLANGAATHLANILADGVDVVDHEILDVCERIGECLSCQAMVEILDRYFSRKFLHHKNQLHRIDRLAKWLCDQKGLAPIQALADQACLSERQFNRAFTNRIGISPKLFTKICRFTEAYRFKEKHPEKEWAEIVTRYGYYDYQHLAKDFISLTGSSPVNFMKEDSSSPEKAGRGNHDV